jgi:hypothetical protein
VLKRAAILLLTAGTAWSQAPEDSLSPEQLQRIERLVAALGARDAFDRLEAQRQLAAYGWRVVPVLRGFDPEEPEVRMRIAGVLQVNWWRSMGNGSGTRIGPGKAPSFTRSSGTTWPWP